MEQSVTKIFKQYLQCSDLAESSQAIKSRAVRRFVELFGDLEIGEINYGHCEDFRNWLAKGLCRNSVNIYLKNIKPFFRWSVARRYIEINPFDQLKLFKIGTKRHRPYEAVEIERMMRVTDTRWRTVILLGLLSLRRAEIQNLTISDIHFDKSYILISPKKDTAYTWRWEIKNHNQAIVPLPEKVNLPDMTINLHRLLIELMDWLPAKQPYIILPPGVYQRRMTMKAAGTLNFEHRGNPWSSFSRGFREILKRSCVERRRFHDLRGTFANTMIQNGMSMEQTRQLMRHSSIDTTAKYYLRIEEQELVAKSAQICSQCYVQSAK